MWKRKTHVGCLREAEARLTPGTVRMIAWYVACFNCARLLHRGVLNMELTALSFVEPGRRVSVHELERWASLAAASAVIVYGFSRRSVPTALLAAAAATPIAYRGLVGTWPFENGHAADDTRSALAGRRGIHVRESIRLETPVAEVYRFWRRLENLPHVFTHLEDVTELGDGRSHWIARGPAGLGVEWDAEIINEVENKVIGWRSLPESDVVTAGSGDVFTDSRGPRYAGVRASPVRTAGGTCRSVCRHGVRPRTFAHGSRGFATAEVRLEAGEIPRTSTGEPAI